MCAYSSVDARCISSNNFPVSNLIDLVLNLPSTLSCLNLWCIITVLFILEQMHEVSVMVHTEIAQEITNLYGKHKICNSMLHTEKMDEISVHA